MNIEILEENLDSFDLKERKESLLKLIELSQNNEIELPPVSAYVNLHIHSFYGYNAYGYSPTKVAWLARKAGLAVAGVIDFDVLDGLEEFVEAARLLNLKMCYGIETRVFVPEFSDKEINSPGEPGIAYHIGIGISARPTSRYLQKNLTNLKECSQKRNIEVIDKVNMFFSPLILDYETDLLALTPQNNPTERHICRAYALKAQKLFPSICDLSKFWEEKLGCDTSNLDFPDGPKLCGKIRQKTMKKGGVGYVQPDKDSFPNMADVNEFILKSGGIPTLCWHDGISEGEKEEAKLLEVAMASGVQAFSVIPNPVYTPHSPEQKLKNLHEIVTYVDDLGLPIVSGTEMNTLGQAIIDDFSSDPLGPLAPIFLKGGHIIYAHSALQAKTGLGYTSKWASQTFTNRVEKNIFFEALGQALSPDIEHKMDDILSRSLDPQNIWENISGQ